MDYNKLVALPSSCRRLVTESAKTKDVKGIKTLFDRLFYGKHAIVRYSLESVERFMPIKIPKQVWKDKRGHCFELSLFWIACLKALKIESQYCTKFSWLQDGVFWNHAFVKARIDGRTILMDPGRRIFSARFRKYRELSKRQTIGNYYANYAEMLNPLHSKSQRKVRLTKTQQRELARKALKCASLALKYDPKETRAKNLIETYKRLSYL